MKIIWTRLALEDINNAYEYIAANNPDAALDTIEQIENSIIGCFSILRWVE